MRYRVRKAVAGVAPQAVVITCASLSGLIASLCSLLPLSDCPSLSVVGPMNGTAQVKRAAHVHVNASLR